MSRNIFRVDMAGKTPEELALEKVEEPASRGATGFDFRKSSRTRSKS